MKNVILKVELIIFLFTFFQMFLQGQNHKVFEMVYPQSTTLNINQHFSKSIIISPFRQNEFLFSLAINARLKLNGYKSLARVILETVSGEELLVMESYFIMADSDEITISNYSEETALLNGVVPKHIKIELEDASILLESISYNDNIHNKIEKSDFVSCSELKKRKQDSIKIERINKQIKNLKYSWQANETSISKFTYQQKMQMFGNPLPNLRGFEYYSGGVFDLTNPTNMKSAFIQTEACDVIESFDWRNRHGQNWITPVRNRGPYGTCSVFAATGATEAFINLYYNQHLDLDLAEQKPIKCIGGSAPFTLNYYVNTGAVLESCAPYNPENSQVCADVCPNPAERIKIGGRIYLRDVADYPFTEEGFKKMLIKYGPLSSGFFTDTTGTFQGSHEMTLVGFYTRSSDGATVWTFKNSWGPNWGIDSGYVDLTENISDMRGGYAPLPPVISLNYTDSNRICSDSDGDGYYNWGIGPKPSTCPSCPSEEDGDDSNSNLGPINDYGYCSHLVRTNEIWQYVNNENANVIVKNGGNLTISGATINLGCDSSFSVELGGTLTFNSGTIQ